MDSVEKRKQALVIVACMGVMFMTGVEGTITATAMPRVASALGGYALFGWTFAAYLLAQAVIIPIYGRLADLYGRKPMFFIGAGLFTLGSLLCGLAPNMLFLVFARVVQGLGAGGIMPVAQTIVGDVLTPAQRARLQGFFASMWALAAVIGPMLGALIVDKFTWPMIFWFNIPIAIIVTLLIAFLFRETPRRAEHKIDLFGAVLLVIAIGTFMLALMQADHLGSLLLPVLGISLISAVLFARQERRAPEPLLPFFLWKDHIIRTCNLGALAVGAASMGVSVFVPTYMQAVLGTSAYAAGTPLMFMSLGWPVAATLSGRLMLRASYRTSAILGAIVLMVGSGMLAMMGPETSTTFASVASFLTGIGLGFLNSPFFVACQDAASWNVRGIAIAFNAFNRMMGAALGTAFLGAAMNTSLARSLPAIADPVQYLVDPVRRALFSAAELTHVTGAVADALRLAFIVGIVIAAAGGIAGWALPKGLRPTNAHRDRPDVAA